jgi:hypothetical protein
MWLQSSMQSQDGFCSLDRLIRPKHSNDRSNPPEPHSGGVFRLDVSSRQLVDRVWDETIWLRNPYHTDIFARCETAECLEPTRVIVDVKKVADMAAQLIVVFIVIPLDGCVFDRTIHALDLSIGPWTARQAMLCNHRERVVWLGQAIFNAVRGADHVKIHLAKCY